MSEVKCPECNNIMELHDTLYSNITTERCKCGEHTGDVYKCEKCNILLVDNFLTGNLENYSF